MGVSGRLKHTLTHSPRGVWPYEVEVVSPNLIIGAVLLLQKLPPSSPWTPFQCCQTFFSEPAPPTLKPAQFASPTYSKNLNSKTSPIFHQNSPKFWQFFGKNRKNVHPAQPAPSPSKILPVPQTLKTARGAGNSPIWQH